MVADSGHHAPFYDADGGCVAGVNIEIGGYIHGYITWNAMTGHDNSGSGYVLQKIFLSESTWYE